MPLRTLAGKPEAFRTARAASRTSLMLVPESFSARFAATPSPHFPNTVAGSILNAGRAAAGGRPLTLPR